MKHKMTMGIVVSFLVVSACLILAALHFPDTESRGMEPSAVAKNTVKEAASESEQKEVAVSTEELTIAIMASKKEQDAAVLKETASGEEKQSNEKKIKASESKSVDTEKKPTEAATTAHEKITEATRKQTTEAQERTPVTTTEDPRRNEPTTSMPQNTEGERPKTATEEKKPSTEATTEKSRVWHPEVTKEVWVVDEEAWTETINYTDYEHHTICNDCGAYLDGGPDVIDRHVEASLARVHNGEITMEEACLGAFRTTSVPVPKTETVNHPETGHWEIVVVSEGYWE